MLIDSTIKNSSNILSLKIEKYKSRCMQSVAKLDALSPLKTLARGYSVVQSEAGKVIKSVNDVKKEDNLKLTLTDGNIDVVVK